MSTTTKTHHVAAFAFPFASHPTGLLHLVKRLATASPDTQFSFFNTTKSNQKLSSIINHQDFRNIKLYNVHDGKPEDHVLSGNPMEAIELFIKATPTNSRSALEKVVQETGVKITCLLTDAFLSFSSEIATELEVPWVAYWTSGPTSLSLHMHADEIQTKLVQNSQLENQDKTLDFIPGMSAIHATDLSIEMMNLDMPFSKMLHNMSLVVPRATAVVLNSFESIHPEVEDDLKPKLQKFLNIGPFHVQSPQQTSEDQTGCLSWLDQHKVASVAYISFGSMLTPPTPELMALSEALEENKVPYLWSFTDTSKLHLLEEFFQRTISIGKVVEWSPQLQVLSHSSVGIFVTHCGWNSVIESITCGVPMICRPFFADQMVNRRLVEDVWQIGVGVEGGVFSKGGMMRTLDFLLKEEHGKNMKENISKLQECASKAIHENGNSTQNFKSLVDLINNWSSIF